MEYLQDIFESRMERKRQQAFHNRPGTTLRKKPSSWSKTEVQLLESLRHTKGNTWPKIATNLSSKTSSACQRRWSKRFRPRRDNRILKLVDCGGEDIDEDTHEDSDKDFDEAVNADFDNDSHFDLGVETKVDYDEDVMKNDKEEYSKKVTMVVNRCSDGNVKDDFTETDGKTIAGTFHDRGNNKAVAELWTPESDRALLRCVVGTISRGASLPWHKMLVRVPGQSEKTLQDRWERAHNGVVQPFVKHPKTKREANNVTWQEGEVRTWIRLRAKGTKLPKIAKHLPRHTEPAVEAFHRQHANVCGLSKRYLLPTPRRPDQEFDNRPNDRADHEFNGHGIPDSDSSSQAEDSDIGSGDSPPHSEPSQHTTSSDDPCFFCNNGFENSANEINIWDALGGADVGSDDGKEDPDSSNSDGSSGPTRDSSKDTESVNRGSGTARPFIDIISGVIIGVNGLRGHGRQADSNTTNNTGSSNPRTQQANSSHLIVSRLNIFRQDIYGFASHMCDAVTKFLSRVG